MVILEEDPKMFVTQDSTLWFEGVGVSCNQKEKRAYCFIIETVVENDHVLISKSVAEKEGDGEWGPSNETIFRVTLEFIQRLKSMLPKFQEIVRY